MMTGSPFYEWFSHNFFVLAVIAGAIGVLMYFLARRKKGWYR